MLSVGNPFALPTKAGVVEIVAQYNFVSDESKTRLFIIRISLSVLEIHNNRPTTNRTPVRRPAPAWR